MTVVITGCSTGIGEACALRLDAAGWRVFAGVRRDEDGARLKARASSRLAPVIVDVADAASIARAAGTVRAALDGASLDGLVNNAGISLGGPLELIPIDEFRRLMEINVVGQLAVTQAFLPLLRLPAAASAKGERARGRIVLMGSISGRLTVPFLGAYSASKMALGAMADALRVELQPWNIHVSIVEPASIATPIWNKGTEHAARMLAAGSPERVEQYREAISAFGRAATDARDRGVPADEVAKVVEHALTSRAPRTRYLVGKHARLRAWVGQVVPDRVRDALLTRLLRLPRRGAYADVGAHGAPARERSGAAGPRERPSRGSGRSPE